MTVTLANQTGLPDLLHAQVANPHRQLISGGNSSVQQHRKQIKIVGENSFEAFQAHVLPLARNLLMIGRLSLQCSNTRLRPIPAAWLQVPLRPARNCYASVESGCTPVNTAQSAMHLRRTVDLELCQDRQRQRAHHYIAVKATGHEEFACTRPCAVPASQAVMHTSRTDCPAVDALHGRSGSQSHDAHCIIYLLRINTRLHVEWQSMQHVVCYDYLRTQIDTYTRTQIETYTRI